MSLILPGTPEFGRLVGFDTSIFDDTDRFRLWAPAAPNRLTLEAEGVSKGGKGKPKLGRIVGIANSEAVDEDGDEIDQEGLSWDYFIGKGGPATGSGLIIFEHPVGILNTVGYPTKVELVTVKSQITGKMVKATRVEADIYLEDKLGRAVFKKARVMQRAGGQRKLGFSIEGGVQRRQGKKVLKARVKWLAITAAPRNHDSWWEPMMRSMIAKSAVGYPMQGMPSSGAIAPLVAASLQGARAINRDELVVKIAKQWPQELTWSQAERVFDELVKVLTAKGYSVRIS
jgi:hypothetical protein